MAIFSEAKIIIINKNSYHLYLKYESNLEIWQVKFRLFSSQQEQPILMLTNQHLFFHSFYHKPATEEPHHCWGFDMQNLCAYQIWWGIEIFFHWNHPHTCFSVVRWWVVVISSDQALNEKWWLRATYAHDHRWWWWWRISIFTVSANLTINRTGRYVLCTWSCNNFQHQRNMDETHVGEGKRCMSLQKITHFSTPVGNAYSAALPSRFQAGQNADQV